MDNYFNGDITLEKLDVAKTEITSASSNAVLQFNSAVRYIPSHFQSSHWISSTCILSRIKLRSRYNALHQLQTFNSEKKQFLNYKILTPSAQKVFWVYIMLIKVFLKRFKYLIVIHLN